MPQLLTSSIGGVPVAWDISSNYLDVSNNLSVNGNTSLVGNVTTSNITGFASQSSLVTISGNLIIPSGLSTTGIVAGQLRYNPTLLTLQFYNGSAWSVVGSSYGVATQTGGTSSTITDTNSYTLLQWTNTSGTKTLIVSTAGLFDMLLVGGGGGGGSGVGYGGEGGGGGGSAQVTDETIYLPLGTYDVTVGAGGIEQVGGAAIAFGGASGINIQPAVSAGRLRFESLGGVAGGSSWSGGQKGYNAGGASYRGGYGGSPSVASFALFGKAGGASDGGGNNGGGGGSTGAGSTRSSTTPATAILGGGGTGLTTTFTGTSVTYGVGGCAGGSSGSVPAAPTANTGN
jgi:hypothetical protein